MVVKEKEKKSGGLGDWLKNTWDSFADAYAEAAVANAGGRELVNEAKKQQAITRQTGSPAWRQNTKSGTVGRPTVPAGGSGAAVKPGAVTAAGRSPAPVQSHTAAPVQRSAAAPAQHYTSTLAQAAAAGTDRPAGTMDIYTRPVGRPAGSSPGTKPSNAARGTSQILSYVYDNADDRESLLYGSKYADILSRPGFALLSQPGKGKASWGEAPQDGLYDFINDVDGSRDRAEQNLLRYGHSVGEQWFKYAFMTPDEVKVYNYMYATEGKKAAEDFLGYLEPELNKQWYSGESRNAKQNATENAAAKTLYSIATVGAAPGRSIASTAATLEDVWRVTHGKEIDPYSGLRQASRLTADTRAAVSEDMSDTGRFFYNGAMAAGDSAMNQLTANSLMQGFGLAGKALSKATATLSSLAMSSEVTANAAAEYKEKGYSDGFALTRAMFRGGIEYASEKIGGEWAIGNIKANPYSFLKSVVLNAIPEGTEEVMSDVGNEAVDLFTDMVLGSDESFIRNTYDYYKQYGSEEQKENPWLWTTWALLKNEGMSFLGGAAATFGTSGVYTYNYRSSVNSAARTLNTTPAEVRRVMAEYNVEDPAEVEALAELGDLHSPEDYRTAMSQAAKAKDYAEKADKSSTQKNDGQKGAAEAPEKAEEQDAPTGESVQETENAPQTAQEGQNRNAYEELQNKIDGLQALTSMRLESVPMGEREDFVLELAKSILKYQGHDAAMEYLATVTGSRQLSTDAGNRVYETLQREEEKAFADENWGNSLSDPNSDFPEATFTDGEENEYQTWSKDLNFNDSVKTLANYYDMQYTDPLRFELLQRYIEDVESGWISPLAGFEVYEQLYNRIQNEIVGKPTNTGLLITGQSKHFLQRVIGTMTDPQKLKEERRIIRRSGVEFNEVLRAVTEGKTRSIRIDEKGRPSIIFYTENCIVSVNPDTGVLIQCNP